MRLRLEKRVSGCSGDVLYRDWSGLDARAQSQGQRAGAGSIPVGLGYGSGSGRRSGITAGPHLATRQGGGGAGGLLWAAGKSWAGELRAARRSTRASSELWLMG
jgi:hypothetical protein